MNIVFDIAEDELKIFLAEAEEQLQMLDEGLVRLEREGANPDLLQTIFRAAHTLKGSSGSIGHRRMAELTHGMESALDGLRKGTLAVSTPLIDTCLEALDALRHLLNEVVDGEVSGVEITELVKRLSDFVAAPAAQARPRFVPSTPTAVVPALDIKPVRPAPPVAAPTPAAAKPPAPKGRKPEPKAAGKHDAKGRAKAKPEPRVHLAARRAPAAKTAPASPASTVLLRVEISPQSIASAARAFQIMLSLQGLGEIITMDPTQAQIETSTPIQHFDAQIITTKSKEEIRQSLAWISELDRILVGEEEINPPADLGAAVLITAEISPNSVAGAARALQLMMSLQSVGEIVKMEPSPAEIQAAVPTRHFMAQVMTTQSTAEITAALAWISELDRVTIGEEEVLGGGATPAPSADVAPQKPDNAAAPNAAPGRPAERSNKAPLAVDKTVRTSVERLDSLMNLVGELITDRNRLFQIRTGFEGRFHGDAQVENLVETAVHIGRITDQLQEEVMRIRMLPISNVFNKFPRLVRDLARKAGKQVELVIRGEETELDRSVIEEISDPLIHLIRNAVDHGLEPPDERRVAGKPERGTMLLTARHEESRIIITVEDDGRGINTEAVKASAVRKGLVSEAEAAAMADEDAIQLIFKSGLSTAKVITDISGRGVGMDIVRTNIERLNGTIVVETRPGHGSQFQVALPLTLAIIPALLVRVSERMLAIPLASIVEAHRIPSANMHTVNGRKVVQLRGQVLPLVRLHDVLQTMTTFDESQPLAEREYVVAVRWGKMEMGLIVEKLVGEQELVIKPLGALVGDTAGISGAAILGDGSVALIVDVPGLFKLAGG
jgi:two-component system, chemotaxis family, sensor kinase CheA